MKPVDATNLLGIACALALAAWGGAQSTGRGIRRADHYPQLTAHVQPEVREDGTRVLVDAGGEAVPLQRYTRILSGSLISDRVLAELCERDRIVGFTPFASRESPSGHLYVDKPRIDARAPVEKVLALKPDLMIVNNVVDPGRVERLREQGVRVFDLGHMRGLDSLLSNIRAVGFLIGRPQRAEAYARALERRMNHVTPPGETARPTALYLNIYADRLYGGAAHTSYHDVLQHAGLRDVAAAAGIDGWPQLTPERVLALDPDYLVTRPGMGRVLCSRDALAQLRACERPHAVLEISGLLLDDPGPAMLDATEALRDALERSRAAVGPD